MPQEYQVISCEPDSLLDLNGDPYEVFGDAFTASEGEKPVCVNTQGDGKFLFRNTANTRLSVQIYYGDTQLLVANFDLTASPQTLTGNVSVTGLAQFNMAWILICELDSAGAPVNTQGCIFEAEELEDAHHCGFKIVASHSNGDMVIDLLRKVRD